jgi:hypothetical protein
MRLQNMPYHTKEGEGGRLTRTADYLERQISTDGGTAGHRISLDRQSWTIRLYAVPQFQ